MKAKIINSGSLNGSKRFIPHKDVYVEKNRYGYIRLKKEGAIYIDCGRAVKVKKVLTDIDTCEKVLVLQFEDGSGQTIEIEMSRRELTDTRILELVKYGVQVNKNSAVALIKTLENSEAKAEMAYQHSRLGFGKFEDIPLFKAYRAIGGIRSEYVGSFAIRPQGSMQEWLEMVQEHVIGTPMSVIFAMALSAVTIDYIYSEYPVDNIIASLIGDSTTGKSTSLMFAVSLGASPSFAQDSFMMSFADTELSLIHKMPSGYPVGIDESSLIYKNATKLLYTLGNGKERSRLRKDMSVMEAKDFHTVIFMSGEQSVLEMADSTSGLRVRVMEFFNVCWTRSAESAECIKRGSMKNFGWIVPKFAKYLLQTDKEALIESCAVWSRKFLTLRKNDSSDALIVRMAKKIGVVLATAECAKEALGVAVDVDYIQNFLLENLMVDQEDYDIGLRAYNEIVAYMLENPLEFGENYNAPSEVNLSYFKIGKIEKSDATELYDGRISNSILYITKEAFNRILEKASFRDPKVILRRLKELKLLVSDKDRYLSKFKLGVEDVAVRGYRLRIPNQEKEELNTDNSSTLNDGFKVNDELEWDDLQ